MNVRQATAVEEGSIKVKVEVGADGNSIVKLEPGMPRVTGLGEEHVETMLELAKVAKLGAEDFKAMLDHLPLFQKLVSQFNFIEQNLLDPEMIKGQIDDSFRATEQELADDMSFDLGGGEYDFCDGWLVKDEEAEEEEMESRKRRTPDELDIAEYTMRFNKYHALLSEHAPDRLPKTPKRKRFRKTTVTTTVEYGTPANPIEI